MYFLTSWSFRRLARSPAGLLLSSGARIRFSMSSSARARSLSNWLRRPLSSAALGFSRGLTEGPGAQTHVRGWCCICVTCLLFGFALGVCGCVYVYVCYSLDCTARVVSGTWVFSEALTAARLFFRSSSSLPNLHTHTWATLSTAFSNTL